MVVTVTSEPDRRDPLPSLVELPAHLIRRLSPRGRRLLAIGGALLVVGVAVLAAVVVPNNRSSAADRDAEQAQRAASDAAARTARWAREVRPIHGRGPAAGDPHARAALRDRRALVAGLEAAVTADARRRAQRGDHGRRYRSASCFRFPKGVDDPPPADDLGRAVAVVECIAVTADVAADSRTTTGSLIGAPYRARVDFRRGRYAFCKIVQQPGELAIQRRPAVLVPEACGGS
jgi:hypothetical protein